MISNVVSFYDKYLLKYGKWIQFFILVTLFVIKIFLSVTAIERKESFVQPVGKYSAWVRSSECALKTGKILVVCGDDGKFVPIEGVSLAEDRGHTFLGNLYSILFKKVATIKVFYYINLFLSLFSVGTFTAFLICIGYGWFALSGLAFVLGNLFQGISFGYGVEASLDGVFFFGQIFLLATVYFLSFPRLNRLSLLFFSFFGLGLAVLLRESVAIIPWVVSFLGGMVVTWINRRNKKVIFGFLTMCLFLGISLKYNVFFNTFRKIQTPSLEQVNAVSGHGFSHTLYAGLGYSKNPWGIKWDDLLVAQHVNRVDPNAVYLSERYFSIVRQLYLEKIKEAPFVVTQIYFNKFMYCFDLLFGSFFKFLIYFSLMFFSIFYFSSFFSFIGSSFIFLCVQLSMGLAMGVLAMPSIEYLHFINQLTDYFFGMWLFWILSLIFSRFNQSKRLVL
ncbi:MAG: hypothetical protein CL678_03015 [Bdellovibrionaceae bacterium]|nr:hypothetical protein [Pseudobdellovibrionaceae bacterium]